MAQPLERSETLGTWCGRSWEGLVDRRCDAFAHARALRAATEDASHRVVSEFLEFFGSTGADLMRDEEEWIFSSLHPAPAAVLRARHEHDVISSLVGALVREAHAGCLDLRVVHALGDELERHLLSEEEEIRPLLRSRPPVQGRTPRRGNDQAAGAARALPAGFGGRRAR